jgi:hypothetical protein
MGVPVESTLLYAMRTIFIECDGLSTAEVTAHPADLTTTTEGYIKIPRQSLKLTKAMETKSGIKATKDLMEDFFPEADPSRGPGHPAPQKAVSTVQTKCESMTEEQFSDLAGRFPNQAYSS